MSQYVAALAPEGGDWLPDRRVAARSVGVDEACISELTAGGGVDAVDFRVSEGFELLGGISMEN